MVGVAESKSALRKRLRRLLAAERGLAGAELASVILPALASVGEIALVGGAIRDVAREGIAKFKSDLDFVVRGSNETEFSTLMLALGATPNRFGGFRLRFRRWKVDVWRLEDTWARTAGLREVAEFSDLLRCTFFDWDAAVFELNRGRLHASDDYLRRLKRGVIDLNLRENPNYKGALVRTLRRGALWNVCYGEELSNFAVEMLGRWEWNEIIELEHSAFGSSVLSSVDPRLLRQRLTCSFWTEVGRVSEPFPKARISELALEP